MMNTKLILVTGATGQQGGAVARALLDRGHRVRGLTRNPESRSAQALAALGAEMVRGDFSDTDTIVAAARGVDAMFAMGTPSEAGEAAEAAQGKALVDAGVEAGVPHFVYTSVASADRETGIPHFESKHEVEKYLATTALTWSVIAPVAFMENLLLPDTLDGLSAGSYAIPMPSDIPLQQIAVEDIGRFGAYVVEHPEQFAGKRIDIAGDAFSAHDAAETLSTILGRKIDAIEVPIEAVRAFSEDWALMFEWFKETGYSADIDGLRRSYPEVGWVRFEEWAGARLPAVV